MTDDNGEISRVTEENMDAKAPADQPMAVTADAAPERPIEIIEGTIILVAEILRAERGLTNLPLTLAVEEINNAVCRLRDAGTIVEAE